jgi:hypothetical protein
MRSGFAIDSFCSQTGTFSAWYLGRIAIGDLAAERIFGGYFSCAYPSHTMRGQRLCDRCS